MDLREKLIELLGSDTCKCDYCEDCEYGENQNGCIDFLKECMADHLIANCVTVQEWIPVTERLPKKIGKYLVCTNRGNVYQTKFYSYPEDKGGHWGQKDKGKSITHWMPLPEPPKGD